MSEIFGSLQYDEILCLNVFTTMSSVMRKPILGFPSRSDRNWTVQP